MLKNFHHQRNKFFSSYYSIHPEQQMQSSTLSQKKECTHIERVTNLRTEPNVPQCLISCWASFLFSWINFSLFRSHWNDSTTFSSIPFTFWCYSIRHCRKLSFLLLCGERNLFGNCCFGDVRNLKKYFEFLFFYFFKGSFTLSWKIEIRRGNPQAQELKNLNLNPRSNLLISSNFNLFSINIHQSHSNYT